MPGTNGPSVTDLATALRAASVPDALIPGAAVRLYYQDFTREDIAHVTLMAKYAVGIDSICTARLDRDLPPIQRISDATTSLTRLLIDLSRITRSRTLALAWLDILASTGPDVRAACRSWCPLRMPPLSTIRAWTWLVGPLAPFAWAAGYPLHLAAIQRRNLRKSELLTTALIHGLRLPGLETLADINNHFPHD